MFHRIRTLSSLESNKWYAMNEKSPKMFSHFIRIRFSDGRVGEEIGERGQHRFQDYSMPFPTAKFTGRKDYRCRNRYRVVV